ncbi:intersectin-2a [Neoarius graeffei]|uniref:intersectin-2a n=1 Tax=Neoarius graeffei TaxID=443677 RepID=UPI00298D24DA|nr:intersectin-2a [Neoarius graeffei]XP_060769788.1 intersectin-2a [Neoarius graeffei]XP_060769789.1 intersectin-2a [Neoarius graeffei]XP_060769790.1 intersectin-2a [Neoarius graeffei]XP_060769791.1 intersectin-2a [Neoarius graeffei]
MNGGFNIWAITPEERGKHDKQFDSLTPTLGYVSGEQARRFFLQSGLPASVLAEIWALADMGKDGKMDRLEFSIAMKLIKLQLQGHPLPPSLPIIMKQTPAPVMTSSSRFGMGSMPNLSIMPTMPILTPMPIGSSVTSMTSLTSMPAVQPLLPLPLIPDSLSMPALPNGTATMLTPAPALSLSAGLSKSHSLLDLASSSSNSSSTTSLASNSPKTGTSDWAVPQSSRLKYRQQFNILDKLMTGYLSGPQVRNALTASNLTQTQLATIWTLADVDRDGQLRAEEFILAMHLVDMAKTGRPLPLTLPADLLPPSFRTGKSCDLPNGSIPLISTEFTELEPAYKSKNNVSFEDKLRENFQRGSMELEKRRQALQEAQRREEEKRREEERREEERRRLREREEQERREREALRRQKEEEQRVERQREMERQREEERLKELERQEAAERQRRTEWERTKRAELQAQSEKEKRDIERLTARKRSLELELEAVGNRHKQISDCLRDAQSKRRVQRAELELVNQKRDGHIADINSIQLQFEDIQRQLSSLAPEKQRLAEKLRNLTQTNTICAGVNDVKRNKCEKDLSCRKLKEQLDALERETTAKLSEVERYNRDMKELRERQRQQQAVLEQLNRVKLEKVKELQRRRQEEEEKRRQEEELARQAKLEQERLQKEEAERQRRLAQEREARLREEQQLQAQARLREAQEKAAQQEKGQREREEKRRAEEEERRRAEEKEREERRRSEEKESKNKGGDGVDERGINPVNSANADLQSQLSALFNSTANTTGTGVQPTGFDVQGKKSTLSIYRALYPFTARNSDELSLEADGLIEVDESTVREPGWLYGTYQGSSGWFPESYAEKTCNNDETDSTASATQNTVPPTNYSRIPRVDIEGPTPTHTPAATHIQHTQAVALCAWTATTDTQLGFSKDDIITVMEQQENWWYGELGENRGWFPKTHVSMVTATNNTHTEPLYSTVDDLDLPDSVPLEEYVALYTYESPESGDLTFRAEDVVLVMEKEGEWWKGCIGDQSGLFPSNYVKPKDSDSTKAGASGKKPEIAQVTTACKATMAEQLNVTPGQLILVLHKNSCGWWLGELQARGKKRQKGWFHSSNVRLLEPNSGKTTPVPQPLCQVIAMYDYKAANGDEMTFQKGQLINVLNKDDSDWWKGEINGVTGLFPTNYVKMTTESDPSQQWCADLLSLDSMSCEERKRQGYIHELIETEQTYVQDLELVLEVFYKPMAESGRLTEAEMSMIFVNWRELIMCNTKLLKALRVRKKTAGERMPVQVIGDILSSELSHMQAYIRFCSCQLNAAALLQQKTDASPEFKLFLKKIATNYRCKGMPLSSFLLKPMQRITRYPLLIRNILENTPTGHVDQVNLRDALERAELLCSQVNEGVREKENSDRLEWLQNHVQCEGVIEHLVFNSLTNCLGPRKLLHSGRVWKAKSNKELWAFLFSDFLLFTYTSKQFSSNTDRPFSPKSNAVFKMYKTPVFLNEVLVKMPSDPSSEDPIFHISHIDRVYTLKADSINERTTWVQRIKTASEHFIETEKLKREKAYQARSQKTSGIGRLLVTAQEAVELKPCKPNGKSNPYCELSMGAQCYTSRPQNDTINPKWNFSCQFFIKDLYQDVLCITVFERDQFSPDDFLGRTEVPVATIKKDQDGKGPLTRRLLLHEVPTGEVRVRLDLQLYEQTPLL